MNVLAFDVGGTSMKYGIVSSSLEIVKKGILDTPNNEIEFLNAINQIIESYKNDYEKISIACLLYTSPSPRDLSTSRMPSSA